MRHQNTSPLFFMTLLGVSLSVGLLLGCPESGGPSAGAPDSGMTTTADTGMGGGMERPDQQLFQTRSLKIDCNDDYQRCDGNQAQLSVQTDSTLRLSVALTENGLPEVGTLITFAFLDVMGSDIQGLSVEDSELQVRAVATDVQGRAEVVVRTGYLETDLSMRAFIPGVGQVEWTIEVRRERVGRLELQAEYQPGSQNRGASSFDSVRIFLLPDNFSEAGCEAIQVDPSALTIHAVREATGIFEVTAEKFESLVVFEATDSQKVYLAVAVVTNGENETIGYGCVGLSLIHI